MSCFVFPCTSNVAQCNNADKVRKNHPLAISAFGQLSQEEQDNAVKDLEGVDREPSSCETPEFITRKLEGLGEDLEGISDDEKRYYLLAVRQEKELLRRGEAEEQFITSHSFRLMFLRAELYDTKKAARRLVRYFKEKHNLFGKNKLAFKIKQEDLGNDGKRVLYSGALSYVGATDKFSRPIVLFRRNELAAGLIETKDVTAIHKVYFYLFQNVMEGNETAQRKGIVFIAYLVKSAKLKPSAIRAMFPVGRMAVYGLPFRIAGYHVCYDDIRERIVLNVVLAFMPKAVRARFQVHPGKTHYECLLKLSLYGIDCDKLPFADDGNFYSDKVKDYLDRQKQLEIDTNPESAVAAASLGTESDDNGGEESDDYESSDEEVVGGGQGVGVQNYIKDFCKRTAGPDSFAEHRNKRLCNI